MQQTKDFDDVAASTSFSLNQSSRFTFLELHPVTTRSDQHVFRVLRHLIQASIDLTLPASSSHRESNYLLRLLGKSPAITNH